MSAPDRPARLQRIGSDDGLVRAIEIVVTPALFGGLGYGVDRLLGIVPIFTVVLATVALLGKFAAEYYRYSHLMSAHEDEVLGGRPSQTRRLEVEETPDGRLPTGVNLTDVHNTDGEQGAA
ncbi:MAG: AtpZ/AtpI family protein [Actinomycetota bacterium]|jgi:hypothetical protein|nr:AtpZ/AtpI family protein [Actinomycetota bacterium]